jgi:hypothetical protein
MCSGIMSFPERKSKGLWDSRGGGLWVPGRELRVAGLKKSLETGDSNLEPGNFNPGPLEPLFRVLDDGDRFDFYLRISG